MSEDVPRPMRADARRNYERIVAAAREAFTAHGAGVPMDDIARGAQVGAGTLYRHFPNRDVLIEAVYRGEIGQLAARAYELLDRLPPDEALGEWFREQVRWVKNSSGLTSTLKGAIDPGSETFAHCKKELNDAVGAMLSPAQAAGMIRGDIGSSDLLRLSHGVAATSGYATDEDVERMLSVVLDGLRA